MPRCARLAVLLSFMLHGGLILTARYRLSYDAYNHLFFGDHYRMDWWSLWEPRWYAGFQINSYPPLIHQLIGALSHIAGLEAAFAAILWLTLTILPVAVYCFARIFTGKTAAGYAALGAAVLPSAFLTAHIFGQLPTLAATVTALFGTATLHRYLRDGSRLDGALTVSLFSTVMALHHATLLLLPWLVLSVLVHLCSTRKVRWQTLLARLLAVGGVSVVGMLLVIWPFWEWGRGQGMQTPIDHASRHNFLKDPLAPLMFFLPMYGPLLLLIPAVFALSRQPRLAGLGITFLVLFLLGLGSTTPLPRLFFGAGWEWLTYDRFAFWASLTFLPFFGMIVILIRSQGARKWMRTRIFLALGTTALVVGLVTAVLPLQPGPVDMEQVRDFLEAGDRSRWRYLTFGFGDQFALLSTLTTATTIDGSYHTARTLPELRMSGIGQIDTAFWLPDGLTALDPILQKAGERGVRWGFVNVRQYVPVLERNGWIKIRTLECGVQVWENPQASLPPPSPAPPINTLASFSWGTLPVLSLVTSLSLGSLRVWPQHAENIVRDIYRFVVALIPFSLGLWYYRTIAAFPHDRVYFTYTDALFFLSDALMVLAVILWICTRLSQSRLEPNRGFTPERTARTVKVLPAAFCMLVPLSVLWSRDWRTSLYISLHILLVVLFILSLRDWPQAWKSILLGFCAALSLQYITGIVGFIQQSTAFLEPLSLRWPGTLDPTVRGAVIVQLPDSESFLRAYGTLPHPNILGGLSLMLLLGPIGLFLRREEPNPIALLLLLPGISLLALTFSRAAWLGLILFALILIWKSRFFDRRRLVFLLVAIVLSFVAALIPYRELVRARTIAPTAHAEEFSFLGRAWLNGAAIDMIREHPWTGVGVGSFILELARHAGEGYVVEPAHNILLLAGAELGIPGLLLAAGMLVLFGYRLIRTQNPNAILGGAALSGLILIGLFDHYLWALPPGRLMLGLVTGMFIGQDTVHDS